MNDARRGGVSFTTSEHTRRVGGRILQSHVA